MDALAFLDVAIGLILVYLVLGLIATSLGEVVAKLFQWRATYLKDAIRAFLCETRSVDPLTQAIYARPEVDSLRDKRSKKDLDPDYIETEAFTKMFLDTVIGEDWRKYGSMPDVQKRHVMAFVDRKPESDPSHQCRKNLANIVNKLIDESAGDLERLQKAIQDRYKQVNVRATGWFKWKMSKALVGVGFLLALLINADTIQLFEKLSADPELRRTAVQIATEYAQNDDVIQDRRTNGELSPAIRQAKEDIGAIAPLVGWTCLDPMGVLLCTDAAVKDAWGEQEPPNAGGHLFFTIPLKIVGFVMTAFAVSIGAPFWFDLLKKVIQVRSALKPKEDDEKAAGKAAKEAGKDKPESSARTGSTPPAAASPPVSPGAYTAGLTGFLPAARDYQAINNLWLARCAALAYQEADEIGKACRAWSMESEFISSPGRGKGKLQGVFKSGTQAFIAWNDEIAIVSFRGTETDEVHDAVTDVEFKLVEPNWIRDPSGVLVHRGFRNALDDVWLAVWDRLQRLGEQSIWLTGHSLGGALAMLAGYRLADRILQHNRQLRERIRDLESNAGLDKDTVAGRKLRLTKNLIGRIAGIYTVGQPRCGNEAFAREVERRVGPHIFRTVNNRDIVPRVPLRAMDYRHAGAVRYIDESGRVHADPALWYRLLDTLVVSPDDVKVSAGETIRDHAVDLYVGLLQNSIKAGP